MLGKQKRQNKQSNTQTYLKGSAQICCRNLYLGQNFFLCPQLVWKSVQFSSVAQSCPTLWPHGLQHSRLPCLSPTPQSCSNSCPSSQRCHSTVSSSVVYFSSCLQSFPASGSFPVSQFFTTGGQSIGVSALASVLQMNLQDWFPLRKTGWISLQSKGLSRAFSNTTVQKYQFFSTKLSSQSNFYIQHDYCKNRSLD